MSDFDNQTYLQQQVNPILHQMCVAILGTKPDKVVDFMIQWLQTEGHSIESGIPTKLEDSDDIHTDSDSEEDDEVFELPSKDELILKKKSKKMRDSVSAEAYGSFNKKNENFVARVISKSEDQKKRIREKLNMSFMFKALQEKEKDVVIGAMEEKQYEKDEMVITQGDDGDVLYLVDEGKLECTKILKKGEEPTHLKFYGPGEAFGELALLYNAPRAASIRAETTSILFALNRETFNYVVKDAAQKKRNRYESFLSKIELLDTMDPYERMKIADVITATTYKKGEYVIRQGENGKEFFFIEEGEAMATKKKEGKEEVVFKYKPGDYFGELALLKDQPRAASIIASTELICVHLDRNSFKRLLGPLEDLLRRNMDRYEKYALN